MVAFQRPIGHRGRQLASSDGLASGSPSPGGVCLAVDNTRRGPLSSTSDALADVVVIPVGCAEARVAEFWFALEAVLRRWRQYFVNLFGGFGMVAAVVSAAPAMLMAAAMVFGGLAAVRVAQGKGGASIVAGQSAVVGEVVGEVASVHGFGQGVGMGSVIVVSAGDSLWSIASERFPQQDPRFVVDSLAAANGGPVVEVGQQLQVPVELQP